MEPVEHSSMITTEQVAALLSAMDQRPRFDASADPEGRNLSVRVARIEATVESLNISLRDQREEFRDFKKHVDERFDKVDAHFDKVDERFGKVDAHFDKVDERFGKVDARFEKMQSLMQDNFKQQFEHVESVRREARRDFYMLGGLMITMLGVMAHGFHWL